MAVRRIPKNHLFVTGSFASRKCESIAQFESLLEKDYMLLLDFDPQVYTFETQPVRLPVEGVPQGYVPDVLVHFNADAEIGEIPPPLLVEIKHTDDLKRNAAKYAPKFAAAREYAAHRGWRFEIINETHIRTPRLGSLKFLRAYATHEVSKADTDAVLTAIGEGRKTSVDALLNALCSSQADRLHWTAVLWALVAQHELLADLQAPISQATVLSLVRVTQP